MSDVPCEMCPVMVICRGRLRDENSDLVTTIMKCLDECSTLKRYLLKKDGSPTMVYDEALHSYCDFMGISATRGAGTTMLRVKR